MTCHVGNSDDRSNLLKQTAEKHGRIDILVANTALNPQYDATYVEMSESRSDKLFNTNLQWSSFLMKETLPYMEPMRGGSIVFITSNSALVPFQQLETYGVSKTSLVGLTKTLVRQCSERNVRINCVAAELVKTECGNIMTENDFITHKKTGMAQPRLFGESQECAGTVSFLCSDDASSITGATIVMATGMDSGLRLRA
ncbi:dehydrogenase/reductase SDR family member 4-like [Ptychodera flava]|uniref:dehydrogenase/reductase SDR family member 4-like n=1 Tax=Ptychodera flava TaxID=63121 RepID=UPI00396A0319